MSAEDARRLAEYADRNAGAPGAIYVGDLSMLAGVAPAPELGDSDGSVSLEALQRHQWMYESEHYRYLLEQASLHNPTSLTSSGEQITVQHACINRALPACILFETFFVPNLMARTEGQIEFKVQALPQLGYAGRDVLLHLYRSDLDSATVYPGSVDEQVPETGILRLWGIYASREQEFAGQQAILRDVENAILADNSGVILNRSWYPGSDQNLFCRESVSSLGDLQGRTVRFTDWFTAEWIAGMRAVPEALAYVEVYTALERGIVDCAMTSAGGAHGQRWHEVAGYMIGPLYGFSPGFNMMTINKWQTIPDDLRRILMEEAARTELEAMRLAAVQNDAGLAELQDAGVAFVPFAEDIRQRSFNTSVMERIVHAWVEQVGGPDNPIITSAFNERLGPIVGLYIEADGTAVKVPINEGPYAGQTVDQVLSD